MRVAPHPGELSPGVLVPLRRQGLFDPPPLTSPGSFWSRGATIWPRLDIAPSVTLGPPANAARACLRAPLKGYLGRQKKPRAPKGLGARRGVVSDKHQSIR